jgi:hypothetical protein
MTEYLRKDTGLISDRAEVVDPNSTDTETITKQMLGRDSEAHALITPPPAEVAAANAPISNPATSSGASTAVARAREEQRVALFIANEANELQGRWDGIQVGFVDEPRKAVQEADALVSTTIKRLAEIFADERRKLEQQWDRSENVSTEDLRLALQRYRSFFARLLAI